MGTIDMKSTKEARSLDIVLDYTVLLHSSR